VWNLQIDYVQLDDTDTDRCLALAAELVGRGVDVIRAGGPELVLKSAVAATMTVPIVMLVNDYDPLAKGCAKSVRIRGLKSFTPRRSHRSLDDIRSSG